ncbi:MAG: hypothetical protein IPK04_15045 [Bdellovibrionales bacterium]|nr:hypothetical protein [Bdellovibrionales bacterium]
MRSWKNSLNDCDREYIAQILEKLPQDSRIIIFLHYWRDIEFEDIAEVLGVRLKEVEFIHNITLRLLSKVFSQKLNEQKRQSREVAA